MYYILKNRKAQSVIEYMFLITVILVTFLVFQKYIVRGLSGRLKGTADSLGVGRLYDPNKTLECAYDVWNDWSDPDEGWYNVACFEANVECSANCDPLSVRKNDVICRTCVDDCKPDPSKSPNCKN